MKLALLTLSFCLAAADNDVAPKCIKKGLAAKCDWCCPESQCRSRHYYFKVCVEPKPPTESPSQAPTVCGDDYVKGCVRDDMTTNCDECCGGADNCSLLSNESGFFCTDPCRNEKRRPSPSSMVVAAPVFYTEE
jgi:hypothetical protein